VIINPNNLKIEGFWCFDRFTRQKLILLSQDIREVSPRGYIVNDHEAMTDPHELVRLKELLELDFQLNGKSVQTVSKKRLGKVSDYATDMTSMYIQKVYASASIVRNLTGGQLSIDRSQIVEITNRRIVVKDIEQKVRRPVLERAKAAVAIPAAANSKTQ
jgi:hypothetical protein